jgi:hypothetical protein
VRKNKNNFFIVGEFIDKVGELQISAPESTKTPHRCGKILNLGREVYKFN